MKRNFLFTLIVLSTVAVMFQFLTGKAAARAPEDYPLVCRGSESLVIGIAPGERNIGFVFTRGTKPAGDGLAPGECSWMDRGMHPNEPDRLSQHVEDSSDSLKVGGTLAPENRWYEELHSSDNYWTFMVSNNGRGQLIATGARPNRDREFPASSTARLPAGIAGLRRIYLPDNKKPSAGLRSEIAVTDTDIHALDSKLYDFTRQLPNDEQAAMNLLFRRAARAPLADPSGTDVNVSFFRAGSSGDNPSNQRGIVVEGGRNAIVVEGGRTTQESPLGSPGGRAPNPVDPLSAALGGDTDPLSIGPKHEDPMPAPDTSTSIGPKHEDPRPAPDTLTSIGPKHEDPRPAPDTLTSIGPKHEDPSPPPPDTINSLAGHLKQFSEQLSSPEQGIMDWLLQRAGTKEVREAAREQAPPVGTPGGLPPLGQFERAGTAGTNEVREAARETGPPIGSPGGLPPLWQALGVARRGDVNNSKRWLLRF